VTESNEATSVALAGDILKIQAFITAVLLIVSLVSAHAAERVIVPGNVIHITVLGYPELSMSVTVQKDGSTDYPLLSNIPIDGMTEGDLAELLQPILARLVERPKIFINIEEHIQLDVEVQGQVNRPGPYTVREPINLQGVLSLAGGATETANLRNISIIRETRSGASEINVDLIRFFRNREAESLPDIRSGDIIYVPVLTQSSLVRVMGAVRIPGRYQPAGDENVADMINLAGGLAPKGNMNRVVYITTSTGYHARRLIKLRDLINAGLTDDIPIVKPGDIIVVEEYNDWQRITWWVQMIRDAAYFVSAIVVLKSI